MFDELVSDFREGYIGNVEFTFTDEPKQKVERAGKVVEFNNKFVAQGAPPREMSSRASCR